MKELIDIQSGLSYKSQSIVDYQTDNILITMGCCEPSTFFNLTNCRNYKEDSDAKYHVSVGDIVVCTRDITQERNQLGCPAIIPELLESKNIICGTNLYIIKNKGLLSNELLYLILTSDDYREKIVSNAKGSAILMLTRDSILNFSIKLPHENDLKIFDNKAKILFKKINNLLKVNQSLTKLKTMYLKKFFG